MATTETTGTRRQRVDARRNAARVLTAAQDAFAELGPDAALEEIARRAGVGIGTLYRHFPTRKALVEAVFRDRFDALEARAEQLRSSLPPGDALAAWLRAALADAQACRGLAAAAMIDMLDDDRERPKACDHVRDAGAALLARAQAAGAVRVDADIDDLLRLVNAIGLATDATPEGSAQAERLLSLMLDGVRAAP